VNPCKAKTLSPLIATQFDKEEIDIKDINTFYWKYIRKHLSNLTNPKVHITGLGEMRIKPWKVDPTVTSLSNKTNYWLKKKPDHPVYTEYKADLDKVTLLQIAMNEEKTRAKNLKEYRFENNI
jgi:hypothetical protein